jgi:hypothetical protein
MGHLDTSQGRVDERFGRMLGSMLFEFIRYCGPKQFNVFRNFKNQSARFDRS